MVAKIFVYVSHDIIFIVSRCNKFFDILKTFAEIQKKYSIFISSYIFNHQYL